MSKRYDVETRYAAEIQQLQTKFEVAKSKMMSKLLANCRQHAEYNTHTVTLTAADEPR